MGEKKEVLNGEKKKKKKEREKMRKVLMGEIVLEEKKSPENA